ncbi:C40 family peptidase [Ferruginibacter sp.]
MRQLKGCLIFLCTIILYACSDSSGHSNIETSSADSLKEQQKIQRAFIAIDSVKKMVQTGDLVVRTGNDFTSESLRSLNQRDRTYSHCGIASWEHDTLFVYHALGGDFNPDQKIRRDNFELFAEPYSNRGIGLYRYQLDAADIDSLMITVRQLYHIGIMFDMKFDLQSNDRMYCAEFVYKSLVMGCNGKLRFTTSQLGDFTFVGVDDLFLQPLCRLQKKILYQ